MKQILIAALNSKIDELSKKHFVGKEQIRITYEFYQFFYYVDRGKETTKHELNF